MPSFGEELRRERELREITLREISESTKISLRYLEALERNDFKHLPGGVFNKGFVRAYAQYIGASPDAMVNAYLLEEKRQEARGQAPIGEVSRRAGAPGTEARVQDTDSWRRVRAWALVSLVLVLIAAGIIAGGLFLWFSLRTDSPGPLLPDSSGGAAPRSGTFVEANR